MQGAQFALRKPPAPKGSGGFLFLKVCSGNAPDYTCDRILHGQAIMMITPSLRLHALLSIYRGQRKRRHCCLSQRLLEQEWRLTGLRRGDLQQAIDDGVRNHLLQRTASDDYELTYLGELATQRKLRGMSLRVLGEWLTLQRVRLRLQQPPSAGPLYRRRDDAPPAFSQRVGAGATSFRGKS